MYDYVIVGSGFYGAICARELTDKGYKCLVLEKRNHIGGNCYTEEVEGINVHKYGPHIFHTDSDHIWNWINKHIKFKDFKFTPVANYKGNIYSLPFNMWTFSQIYSKTHPDQVEREIKYQGEYIKEPKNLEEQAIKLVGKKAYNILIKGYTKKQWKKEPKDLPREIIKRLPVRLTYDNNYFNDRYQGIPIGGYTKIFESLLGDIEVKLGVDYLEDRGYWDSLGKTIIYTGPIDKFYRYRFGELEYKSVRFEEKIIPTENYQGTPVMNYTEFKIPFTRCIEHKHFEGIRSNNTVITYEYPVKYRADKVDPYYPVNDVINNLKYSKYKEVALTDTNIRFGGRLAEYKYYDMDDVIVSALRFCDDIEIKGS